MKIPRWCGARGASSPTSAFPTSCICAWCVRPWPMAACWGSALRPRCRSRASTPSGPRRTSPTSDPSISAKARLRSWSPIANPCWRRTMCAMWASPWRSSSPRTPMWPRTPPISWSSISTNCPSSSRPMRRPASSRRACPRRRPSSPRALATWRALSPTPMRSSRWICRWGAIRACRWRRAAPSGATTARAMCWSSMAPQRCRTRTGSRWRACSGARRPRCTSSNIMWAGASAFAARSTRRTFWSSSPPCASNAR